MRTRNERQKALVTVIVRVPAPSWSGCTFTLGFYEMPRPPDNKSPSTDPFHRHTVPSGLFELLLFLVAKTLYQ